MEKLQESQEFEDLDLLIALQLSLVERKATEERRLRQDLDSDLNDMIDQEVDIRTHTVDSRNEQDPDDNLDELIKSEIDRVLQSSNLNLNHSEDEENAVMENRISRERPVIHESIAQNSNLYPIDDQYDRESIERLFRISLDSNRMSIETEKEQTFKCSLCLEEYSIEVSETFGCPHIFCKECLSNLFTSKVNDGDILGIECPSENCSTKADDSLIRSLLPKGKIERYETFMVKKITENFEDIMNCPKCNEPVECDLGTCTGICNKCNYVFCTSCSKDYHGSEDCPDFRQRLEEDEKSEELIQKTFKKCPGCHTSIEKDVIGCNHMICAKCLTQFCWLCLDKIPGNKLDFERHFARCLLFSYDFVD